MKRTVLTIACLALICCLQPPTAQADPKSDLVEKYYRYLQRSGKFDNPPAEKPKEKIPEYERDEIYACILDRGAQDQEDGHAVSVILLNLEERRECGLGGHGLWGAHLERAVLAQTRHKDSVVRRLLVGILAEHDKDKYRDLILSYLDDPSPPVQYHAVSAIAWWPDAKIILNGYVRKHSVDTDSPANPVLRAKQILGKLKQP